MYRGRDATTAAGDLGYTAGVVGVLPSFSTEWVDISAVPALEIRPMQARLRARKAVRIMRHVSCDCVWAVLHPLLRHFLSDHQECIIRLMRSYDGVLKN